MIPLNTHTHYSLLEGYCKPDRLARLCQQYEYKAIGISDINSLSGTINFMSALEGSGVKPIIGTKLKLDTGGYIHLIARNLAGWKELVGVSTYAAINEHNVITLDHLKLMSNCICITGDINSSAQHILLSKYSIFTVQNPSQSLSFYLSDDYESKLRSHFGQLKEIFGEHLYVGTQRCNVNNIPADKIIADILSNIALNMGIKTVALNNTYVHDNTETDELRILLASKEKTKFREIQHHVMTENKASMFRFFHDNHFGLYDAQKYHTIYSDTELQITHEINDKIEPFSLLKNPESPNFECPQGMSQADYLLDLCRKGWSRVLDKIDTSRTGEYTERIKYELSVINKVGLEGYFLVVQDYVNWAKNKGILVGPGRGSAAGCLVSYLLNITSIDPIIYKLMFERFYNEGRNAPGKISFPDVDVDFPVYYREDVINYIRHKYGTEQVSQVFTLQEIQGRSAIRKVLSVYGACPNEFINEISKKIPQKAAIADKLEEEKEKSILRWTLYNEPEVLKDWCMIDENDNLVGEYAAYFDKAIKIEGTFNTAGKHASAVVVSNDHIASICPMVKDKSSNELIAAIEYEELEKMGFLKLDILGTAVLDKLMVVNQLLEKGHIDMTLPVETETEE